MTYQLKAVPLFERQYKKRFPKEKEAIRAEIKKIKANPYLGEVKKGSLKNVRVRKFKIHKQLYLLAYELDKRTRTIYLYSIATHENYYTALQRYLK